MLNVTQSPVFVGSPAARVLPEDVSYTVIDVFVVIVEELWVYLLHILQESKYFLHIILCLLLRELVLPAVQKKYILAALDTKKRTSELHQINERLLFLMNVLVHPVTTSAPHKVQPSRHS